MKKLVIVFLSVIILSVSSVIAGLNPVVGSYNNVEVTQQEVMTHFKPMIDMQPENKGKEFVQFDKKLQELLVRGYINQKLLEGEADKIGIRHSKIFKEKMQMVELQMIQQELLEQHLKTVVTDRIVDAEYNVLVKNLTGQREVKSSHILVDTEEKAQEIKKKINKGEKFENLVEEFSKDHESKSNNGELGYILKGQLVPEFESKAFAMKKGEVSDPIQTQFGWHIIKVLDSRTVQIPTKEHAENGIRKKLSREAIEKYLMELADKAEVKLHLQ